MAEQDRSGPDRDAAPRGRGRLRIYLGAAPGVGKTFAMLDEGWRRARRGTDVVVGYVETHGRPNTAAQLRDLEVVPRRQIVYRGQTFEEMDLPAVLARAPQVVLVDELAHTNVPGSEHDKRIADVQDLLAAGIDVVTTLNVQHLESVNDVVEKITGIAHNASGEAMKPSAAITTRIAAPESVALAAAQSSSPASTSSRVTGAFMIASQVRCTCMREKAE